MRNFWLPGDYLQPKKSEEIHYQTPWIPMKDFMIDPKGHKSQGCDHKWKNYVGLKESYDFCELCDAKKETT